MEHLTDFKPIERVILPGLGELNCSGLILIVGPNSSGKTQFLQDLYHRISGVPRALVVAQQIEIRKPDYEPFLKCLEEDGYVTRFLDENDTPHLRPMTTYLGTGQGAPQIQANQAQSWHQSFAPTSAPKYKRNVEFLNYFGRLLVTALFLERRLISVNQVGMFDYQTQPPQNDLHALYMNDFARNELFEETVLSFSKAVWPDASRGNTLCLRVADEEQLPTPEQRLSPSVMGKFRTIETEGDGLKSYVATCIALLLGRRPVCLVDEPEMCLHPPQAYSLGRFIGRFGASTENATFIATHSSHVLRGVIQTAEKLQIVRLTRRGGGFHAHLVPQDALAESLTKPTVRAESVLDGIFAQAVVILEGDSDRTVYQAVWETLNKEFRFDLHFAPVGGTGGFADTCRLYRTLKIPVAVLADLDIIIDAERLRRVISQLSSDTAEIERLVARADDIVAAIKAMPPTISADDVKKELENIYKADMEWSRGDDGQLRDRLLEIARGLDRMTRLKRGGTSAMPRQVAEPLILLLHDLQGIGLFVVPVGELEEWLAGEGISASKQNKWAWANEAAVLVRQCGSQPGDVWDFVRGVAKYLQSEPPPTGTV